jgi:hypothetical protein
MKITVWRVAPSLLACCTLVPTSLCWAAAEPNVMPDPGVPLEQGVAPTIVAAPAQSEKIELHLRLKEGQAYGLRSLSEQKIVQTVNNQKINVTQIVGFDMRYDVLKVDAAGNLTIKFTYTGADFHGERPDGNHRIRFHIARLQSARHGEGHRGSGRAKPAAHDVTGGTSTRYAGPRRHAANDDE